jgi:hypothetical protein
LINPFWIEDPNLQKGEVDFLTTAETEFWKDLIDAYLRPIDENKEEQVYFSPYAFFSSYPFPSLNGVGTTCFSSCYDKDSAIIFTTGLPDVNPP